MTLNRLSGDCSSEQFCNILNVDFDDICVRFDLFEKFLFSDNQMTCYVTYVAEVCSGVADLVENLRSRSGTGVQESTQAGVGVFQQEPEQDQEWIFSIGIVPRARVIFYRSVYEIILSIYTLRDL